MIISGNVNAEAQLHGFCDASEQAYGACIYIYNRKQRFNCFALFQVESDAFKSIAALSHLELCGAVLLVKLMDKVIASLNVRVYKRYYWTDSKIVFA